MRIKRLYQRYMIRPIIYQVSARLAISLALALLLREFAGAQLSWVFAALSAVFLLLGWVAWLRLDGAKLPPLDHRLFRRQKRGGSAPGGDIADYLDDKPLAFEELTEEERDACLLVCDPVLAAVFGVLTFCL